MAFFKSLFGGGEEEKAVPPSRSKTDKIYGKYFFARNMSNDLVLSIKEGMVRPGTTVVTWRQKPSVMSYENQLWYQHLTTSTIRSVLNDFCLEVNHDDSLAVKPYEVDNVDQQWVVTGKLIRKKDNPYLVIGVSDQDAQPGVPVRCSGVSGKAFQHWDFKHQTAKTFYIKSKMNGKVLDVRNENRSPGAQVIMYSPWSEPRENQLWYEDTRGIIRSRLNDFALDSSTGWFLLQPYNPENKHHQWIMGEDCRIHRLDDTNEVLDIRGASSFNCAEAIPYQYHGKPNQKWTFEFI